MEEINLEKKERRAEEYQEPEWMTIIKRLIKENQNIFKDESSRHNKEVDLPQALVFSAI